MRGVAIVSPVRTAVGNFGGAIRDISAAELASTVIKETIQRSGVDPAKIDDVILGHGYPNGGKPGNWSAGRAEIRSAHRGPRVSAGPPLLLWIAGHSERRHADSDRKRRRGAGRGRGKHEQRRILC